MLFIFGIILIVYEFNKVKKTDDYKCDDLRIGDLLVLILTGNIFIDALESYDSLRLFLLCLLFTGFLLNRFVRWKRKCMKV